MDQRVFASSHRGGRRNNEDAFLTEAKLGLYAVADGMGGAEGGEIASAITIAALRSFFGRAAKDRHASGDESRMIDAIMTANRDVTARQRGRLSDMGSTLAAVLIRASRALIANVGDSRVYVIRDGEIRQVTRDHSMLAEMRDAGVPLGRDSVAQYGHVLTRAVGVRDRCRADLFWEKALPGDIFVLCTDGVSDVLAERELEFLVQTSGKRPADRVVERAIEAGAQDNVTAVVVRIEGDGRLRSSEKTVDFTT